MAPPSRKRPWSRPLADLVGAAVDPVMARQGFAESDLILNWDDIVGARLAASSRPIKLQWPPRPAGARDTTPIQPATLVVRVESAFAPELQHMADQVLSRVNAHFGWRCVGRIALRQGPIERQESGRRARREPSPEAVAKTTPQVAGIEAEGLREALLRLGARISDARSGS